ncbi:hypothetical protein UF75_2922 [Desulfosporosinus sp. I2]|uniref:STAS domain-containing protein n=1 Tax=Desulfosporosinus sp. I2 TaxID=1617025 RepID=UPI0005ED8C74|nr:STAS domain-containing protein [Desulfosporosinus sp. I2]KJR46685.1 hypothetical protein UF75_2922 [Desulfosporosinus sp. I2]
MSLEIERKKENDIMILQMSGVLDISTVELLQNSINHLGEIKKVICDFENIRFVDSTGVGGIASVIRACRKNEITIKINNILPEVFEVLDILGLPEIFGEETFEVKQV